jgi:two-component system phosphate regulon response regulator PhoB
MSTKLTQKRILVADDEPDVLQLVSNNLKFAGYQVVKAEDGLQALTKARETAPALIVLDLMLPQMSGLEVCKVLKRESATSQIPIIMLTAKAEEVDRIVGLELGADDYMTKPFSPRELVLRVKSVLRRTLAVNEERDLLAFADVCVDRTKHEVTVAGQRVVFTATEFKLLTLLIDRRGRMQSRDKLLNDVWGYEAAIDTRTVDTHIRRLREKLGDSGSKIETVRGFGYRLAEAES